jgi:hypothetical protein
MVKRAAAVLGVVGLLGFLVGGVALAESYTFTSSPMVFWGMSGGLR